MKLALFDIILFLEQRLSIFIFILSKPFVSSMKKFERELGFYRLDNIRWNSNFFNLKLSIISNFSVTKFMIWITNIEFTISLQFSIYFLTFSPSLYVTVGIFSLFGKLDGRVFITSGRFTICKILIIPALYYQMLWVAWI